MLKQVLLYSAFIFLFLYRGFGQEKGILPLTGAKYYKEGIGAKSIEVKMDGAYLLNNRLLPNNEVEFKLINPTGIIPDKNKNFFAAAEINIVSQKGVVLSSNPNIFKENAIKGFMPANFSELSCKILLSNDILKTEAGCTVKIRYYDLKSKAQLRLEFPVILARVGEKIPTTKSLVEISTTLPSIGSGVGVKMKKIPVTIDTSIRVSPKMAYASFEMFGIDGSNQSEILSGKESFWVYDNDLNDIRISDRQLKEVKAAMGNNLVDYTAKIPFRLKTDKTKLCFVRFRWESNDRKKLIDMVVKI